MLFANKRTQKAKKGRVAYFLSLNLFCKKLFKSRIKNVTQCNNRNKKTYYSDGNFA